MNTMKFIEQHIYEMMNIWAASTPSRHATPMSIPGGDAKLLNGPKLDGDVGHARRTHRRDVQLIFRSLSSQ
jgi:chemotaxis protein CheZ